MTRPDAMRLTQALLWVSKELERSPVGVTAEDWECIKQECREAQIKALEEWWRNS